MLISDGRKGEVLAFRELLKHWDKGLECMGLAEKQVPPLKRTDFEQDFATAKAFRNMVLSDINVTKFGWLRKKYYEDKKCDKKKILTAMKKICLTHMALNNEMQKLIGIEPRIGYHGEAHYRLITKEKLDKTKENLLGMVARFG